MLIALSVNEQRVC